MGHRQNEPCNAAGLILKLRIIVAVQDQKNSFYMQILVPLYFWLVPPHFFRSSDGTNGTDYYHLLTLSAMVPIFVEHWGG